MVIYQLIYFLTHTLRRPIEALPLSMTNRAAYSSTPEWCRTLTRRSSALAFALFLNIVSAYGQNDDQQLGNRLKVFGGMSIPVGDFASTSSPKAGFSKPGISVGAEFYSEVIRHLEAGLGGAFNLNTLDQAELERHAQASTPGSSVDIGSWELFWLMGGVGFRLPVSRMINCYGRGNAGLLVGRFPEGTLVAANVQTYHSSATSTAAALGVSFGVLVDRTYDIGFCYFSGEPEYEVTLTSGSNSQNARLDQPTTNIQLTLGYSFH